MLLANYQRTSSIQAASTYRPANPAIKTEMEQDMRDDNRSTSDGIVVPQLAASSEAAPATSGALLHSAMPPRSPINALKALQKGNMRWAEGKSIHPRSDFARRKSVAREGQKPFAAILSCADSRVPPELLFDQGVGDLFAVRVAGNSVAQLGLQSLEYAVGHLGVATIMVLGHQNCGAVKGAVEMYPAASPEFLSLIYPAITNAQAILREHAGNLSEKEALCREAADQHVIVGIRQLQSASPFKQLIELGQLKVIGGRYDLDTGRVTMLAE